jgi:tetrahydromethanopterin S-methyltransferase subunit F
MNPEFYEKALLIISNALVGVIVGIILAGVLVSY